MHAPFGPCTALERPRSPAPLPSAVRHTSDPSAERTASSTPSQAPMKTTEPSLDRVGEDETGPPVDRDHSRDPLTALSAYRCPATPSIVRIET